MAEPPKEAERTANRAPRERPVGGYAALIGLFTALVAGFSTWLRATGRRLPERVPASDLLLVTVATHKASRLVSRDRVTSAVRAPFTEVEEVPGEARRPEERPAGSGARRAVGELVLCPYCLSVWIASAFAGGLVVAPRPTRWAAGILTTVFGSDVLQILYRTLEDSRR
jgi:hypothetical protein